MNTRLAAGAVITALALGLSACGGETKPKPMDAVTKMQARLKTYKTIDFTVTGSRDGKTTTMRVHGPTSGTSLVSDVTEDGSTGHAIYTQGAIYVKADGDALKNDGSSDASSKLFANKWLKRSAALSDSDNLMKEVFDPFTTQKADGKKGSLSAADTSVTSEKLNGQNAWKLSTKDGKHTAWLKKGTFDLLKITGTSSSDDIQDATITINKHDEPENITAPADALDLSTLGK